MSSIIIAFFNKTGINYPYYNHSVDKFHQEMEKSKILAKPENFNDAIEVLKNIERALYKHADKYGCMVESTYEKASKELNYLNSTAMIIVWISLIYHYEKYGLLDCNNDSNGIVIQESTYNNLFKTVQSHYEEQHNSLKVCGICKIKGAFKCPLCNQNYCCKEHQKQDWKSHKKVCSPKKDYVEYN